MNATGGVLSGVTVVDFTHIFSGPYATQILGDLGAEVIKIERADGGDPSRYYGATDPAETMSGAFLAVNRNKRSLSVDMSNPECVELVSRLARSADVVVENFRSGVMKKWGLDYETLSAANPRLVFCSITGFGAKGELAEKRANDLVVQAYSGLLSFTGEPGRPPVRCGTAISDFSAGLNAVIGILAALLEVRRSGRGQYVETSLFEASLGMMSYFFAEYWKDGIVPTPMGTANRLGMPNQAFPTSDGYVAITAANDRMFRRTVAALGAPELGEDPRFVTLALRYKNRDELVDLISARTAKLTTAECVAALDREGVSCAPIKTVADVANDAQVAALGAAIDVPTQNGGSARVIGPSYHLTATPTSVRHPVPVLGGNSVELARSLGYSDQTIGRLLRDGALRDDSVRGEFEQGTADA